MDLDALLKTGCNDHGDDPQAVAGRAVGAGTHAIGELGHTHSSTIPSITFTF